MTATRGRRILLALLLGLVIVVVLFAIESCVRHSPESPSDPTGASVIELGDGGTFEIHGSLEAPLSPGRELPLDVTMVNPGSDDLVVSGLRVSVDAVEAPNATALLPCTAGDFAVTPGVGEVLLDADATVALSEAGWDEESWPRLSMLDTDRNQDGCKGASLTLEYTAEARR